MPDSAGPCGGQTRFHPTARHPSRSARGTCGRCVLALMAALMVMQALPACGYDSAAPGMWAAEVETGFAFPPGGGLPGPASRGVFEPTPFPEPFGTDLPLSELPPAGIQTLERPDYLSSIDWERATAVDLTDRLAPQWRPAPFGEFFYRGAGRQVSGAWLIGTGDRMGIFTLPILGDKDGTFGWFHYDIGAVVHFISGPRQTDLPPRVYDLTFALPRRARLGDDWVLDVTFRVGWYSDFEGSARNAIRFPSHAVLYRRVSSYWQWLLGVDYLDRDDVSLLPVMGALWTPNADWRVEAVFPKPLVAYRLAAARWVYLASEMGGGTWGIERVGGAGDMFTYRDFRLVTGLQLALGQRSVFVELGWVFGRHLKYRSGTPTYDPPDTVLLRSVFRY